jgi:hypothetical protein
MTDSMGRQMTFLQTTKIRSIIENFSGSDGCYVLGFRLIPLVSIPFRSGSSYFNL